MFIVVPVMDWFGFMVMANALIAGLMSMNAVVGSVWIKNIFKLVRLLVAL